MGLVLQGTARQLELNLFGCFYISFKIMHGIEYIKSCGTLWLVEEFKTSFLYSIG